MTTSSKLVRTGRAKTVLVFGNGDAATAALSSVIVQAHAGRRREHVHFSGPVTFDETTAEHVRGLVAPIADRVFELLSLPRRDLEIPMTNLGAASGGDLAARVSGFSADVPILLAILSARLGMPVPNDLVATGHLASAVGEIAFVKAIPAKLTAALADPSIQRFVHPDLDREISLRVLTPNEAQRATGAIASAKETIRTVSVGDIAELVQAVFADEAIVHAGLRERFFAAHMPESAAPDPLVRTARFLAEGNENRFWIVLERLLLAGESDAARRLLAARARYQIERETYAEGFGRRLLQLLQSLPPAVLRIKSVRPLLSMRSCIELSQFAAENDYDDVQALHLVAAGKPLNRSAPVIDPEASTQRPPESGNATLDVVLSEINALTLAERIGLPIDAARAWYQLGSSTVDSKDEFQDIVTAFGQHLLRRSGWATTPLDPAAAAAEGLDLLRKAFPAEEQYNAALAEAVHGAKGGLRVVLDAITDRFKKEQTAKHVNRVLVEALDPLDHEEKVAFMTAFLARLAPHLTADIQSEPPERYAGHWKEITRAYVESLDRVNELLRTF